MAWKAKTSKTSVPPRASDPAKSNGEKPPEVADFLDKVERLLLESRPENALELFARNRLKSVWITNANGVCLLRLDRAKQAVDLFRGLVLSPGVVSLREDVPAVFKTNFATALLAHSNLGGCLSVLHEINDEENPAVRQLRSAIQRFRESVSPWARLQWRMGVFPSGPVAMDFPLGNLG